MTSMPVKISPRFLSSGLSRAQISYSRGVSVVACAVPPTCRFDGVSSAAGQSVPRSPNSNIDLYLKIWIPFL